MVFPYTERGTKRARFAAIVRRYLKKKSNRDRHVKQCHKDVNDTMEEDSNALEVQSEERPTMAQFDEPPQFDEVPSFDDKLHLVQSFSLVPPSDESPAILPQCDYPVQLLSPAKDPERSSHVESIICNIKKIKSEHHYEKKLTENLILKLKRYLKSKKAEAVEFIKHSFGDMLDGEDFLSCLSKKLEYKPNRLKSLLQDKAPNIWKSLQRKTYQDVYDFWLQNGINSNYSRSNVVNITKRAFLEQYNSITYANLMEKEVTLGKEKVAQRKSFLLEKKSTLTA